MTVAVVYFSRPTREKSSLRHTKIVLERSTNTGRSSIRLSWRTLRGSYSAPRVIPVPRRGRRASYPLTETISKPRVGAADVGHTAKGRRKTIVPLAREPVTLASPRSKPRVGSTDTSLTPTERTVEGASYRSEERLVAGTASISEYQADTKNSPELYLSRAKPLRIPPLDHKPVFPLAEAPNAGEGDLFAKYLAQTKRPL